MALRMVFDKEKTQSIKQVMPVELIVYKVAVLTQIEDRLLRTSYPVYISPICGTEYSGGEQCNEWDRGHFTVPLVDQPETAANYYPGFHSFTKKTTAENWHEQSRRVFKMH